MLLKIIRVNGNPCIAPVINLVGEFIHVSLKKFVSLVTRPDNNYANYYLTH